MGIIIVKILENLDQVGSKAAEALEDLTLKGFTYVQVCQEVVFWSLHTKAKRDHVLQMLMQKLGPTALNFGYDFWVPAAFCKSLFWDTLFDTIMIR